MGLFFCIFLCLHNFFKLWKTDAITDSVFMFTILISMPIFSWFQWFFSLWMIYSNFFVFQVKFYLVPVIVNNTLLGLDNFLYSCKFYWALFCYWGAVMFLGISLTLWVSLLIFLRLDQNCVQSIGNCFLLTQDSSVHCSQCRLFY